VFGRLIMTEIRLMPVDLAMETSDYFATATDPDTTLCAPGIFPCIGALSYRQGHLGLGHFDPVMDPVMHHLSSTVMPQMSGHGDGDIGCRLYTGMSFAARPEYQGRNIVKLMAYEDQIREMGFRHTGMQDSKTVILANNGPALMIKELQARLTGDDLDKVRVLIQYIGKNGYGKAEESLEEFEINTRTDETRVIQPFTGTDFMSTL
jgi:hypothetical protein